MSTPAHVAIIMDGNGRWAKARGLPRLAGHRAGVEALRRTVRAAPELGIRWLTVYAFSSENWSRPTSEVNDLMGLLNLFIRRDLADLHHAGVRVRVIGDRQTLQLDIRALLEEAEMLTAGNTKFNLVVAFNYGSRDEIVRAVRTLAAAAASGEIEPAAITAETMSAAPSADRRSRRPFPPARPGAEPSGAR